MATIPSDPLFPNQRHLQNNTAGLLDLNVVDVWDDYTGVGVEVAVIDDAMQRTHPDLDGNYSIYKDWDFEDNDTDASPSRNGLNSEGRPHDAHGTSVLGVIGAEANNGIGGVGVAYGSTIFGFKTGFQFNAVEDAINNASGLLQTANRNREADIVNMSFGWLNYNRSTGLRNILESVDDAAEFGRNGLGTIMVKSAGNSRQHARNEDTNASLLSASPHTITVAGVNQNGFINSASTHGASVLISAFYNAQAITDRTGDEGYNRQTGLGGNYTNFSGTSASAPMVSGVVALMLEANPNLGWRDVQEILAYSARHVGSNVGTGISGNEEYAWSFNGADNWNGGGLHFSNDYGFGLVDAKAAVRLAETWNDVPQTSANDATVFRDFLNATRTISTTGTSFSQYISSDIDIEHVEVDINFAEWYDLGDLELRLTSPDGTTSILIDNTGEDNGSSSGGFGSGRWEFFSNQFRGESTVGTWTVQLFDSDSLIYSPITISDLDITFYGQSASSNDNFIFTEEYSDYDGLWGHSRSVNGGSGVDTINAAAVDSRTTLDLGAGTGRIDGVDITVSSIEHVFTGDGNDSVRGNSSNNALDGGRGDDYLFGDVGADELYGDSGSDDLYGGGGHDFISGGNGHDLLNGWYGDDELRGERGRDDLSGGAGRDTLFGGAQNDQLNGDDGDDFLYGGRENDTLIGGNGDDLLDGAAGPNSVTVNSYTDLGRGEVDILVSGSFNDRDSFKLAHYPAQSGSGTVYDRAISYLGNGSQDYAVIQDFDVFNFAGDIADRILLFGSSTLYSLANVTTSLGYSGAGIYFSNDLVGVVEGFDSNALNLSDSNQFQYYNIVT